MCSEYRMSTVNVCRCSVGDRLHDGCSPEERRYVGFPVSGEGGGGYMVPTICSVRCLRDAFRMWA